ncbi:hypothetical protein Lcho_2230 [Leptothrix cholodnii SP-6]|uniref:Phage tail assembly chaperone-like domain-containing protein n=1 Tax=Leptothrix cholodnii (strain ATCC 51168 / LMG 8142 / SP-6) TaxID=395495 RepID=B1Y3G8_LEPCP|nr:tail fiber assembly protein [Leptothrix cholodnii]ACB34496.1 hypothetical protein Lcho_2230 [Leptothrix cholodnii SP-6]
MSMGKWSFCDAGGVFTGAMYSGPEDLLEINTPAGCAAIPGDHDHLRVRVDLETGAVVPYRPPPPADDDWQTWAWDETAELWVSVPTLAAIAATVRSERDRRMAGADWVTLRAMRRGEPVPTEWAAYLQALADVPAQPGFPFEVTWPVEPA